MDELPTLPEPWRGATTLSDYPLRLAPDELRALIAELTEVIQRYRPAPGGEAPAGTAAVTVQFQAFRRPGVIEPDPAGDPADERAGDPAGPGTGGRDG